MKLILVRHGETLWNREKRVQGFSDIELSDLGRQQAERLAARLREERIEAIYCSTLRRAYQTAQAIGQFHPVPIKCEEDLRELNQGDFESLTFRNLRDNYAPFLTQWITDPGPLVMPNGESLNELQERAWRVIERIVAVGKDTLVVSHGFTIITILCRIQGTHLTQFRQAHVDLASQTLVEFANGVGAVISLNDISHLQ